MGFLYAIEIRFVVSIPPGITGDLKVWPFTNTCIIIIFFFICMEKIKIVFLQLTANDVILLCARGSFDVPKSIKVNRPRRSLYDQFTWGFWDFIRFSVYLCVCASSSIVHRSSVYLSSIYKRRDLSVVGLDWKTSSCKGNICVSSTLSGSKMWNTNSIASPHWR